jgi:hypothetical protein
MAEASRSAPKVPGAMPVSGKAREEFDTLKRSLSGIPSWEMSPSGWDSIQIAFVKHGTEQQARSFVSAIQLPTPEM